MMMRLRFRTAMLACILALCTGCAALSEPTDDPISEQPSLPGVVLPEPEPQPEPEPEPVVKSSTATIAATGDILMHYPIIKTGASADGTFHFESIFPYIDDYVASADYAVANLETTLCGLDNGYKYQGYPRFNCPDGIVDSLKRAGFDMLLTANNHTYDTGEKGLLRTLSVIDEAQLERIGTNAAPNEKKYTVQEINDIKVGMLCYTYETEDGDPQRKSLNCLPVADTASPLINSFHYGRLEAFYAELGEHMAAMEAEGAEATVLFIHWGNEYQLQENETQREMAQQICNLGIDVIVGGHPHVIQPVDLIASQTDPEHSTVCLYSMGNAVSNQRVEQIPSAKGYTEDGVLFQVTFAKYSDGTVLLESVDILPTWVNLTTGEESGKKAYEIIPLDQNIEDWKQTFTLTDAELSKAEKSYQRTMSIVGEGLEKIRTTLDNQPTPADE